MIIEGFSYAAVKAGIRKKDRLDLGLIYADNPCVAAGVFTTSKVKAAPVLLDIERMQGRQAQAILVNSGIANACTGEPGLFAARACGALVAQALDIPEDLVQICSTGVIGQQLVVDRFAQAMGSLIADLKPENFDKVTTAIMTTDTVPKTAGRRFMINDQEVKIFGMTKGAGMIMPNMATMLCFVMTDADISAAVLDKVLKYGVGKSFNRITVDGDTSTNDTVLVLANGKAGNPIIDESNPAALAAFQRELTELLQDLALQIVADGEGATKLVTIRVQGAADDRAAEQAARTIANSALVKTAFFGEDANWGRIIAALGRSGIDCNPDRVDIAFDEVLMVKDGLGQGADVEREATAVLKKKRFTVTVDLKSGPGVDEVYTCDFSLDYVKINADYRS